MTRSKDLPPTRANVLAAIHRVLNEHAPKPDGEVVFTTAEVQVLAKAIQSLDPNEDLFGALLGRCDLTPIIGTHAERAARAKANGGTFITDDTGAIARLVAKLEGKWTPLS